MEAELKEIEKNVQKIKTILSSMDNSSITATEHLNNLQVKHYDTYSSVACNHFQVKLAQMYNVLLQKISAALSGEKVTNFRFVDLSLILQLFHKINPKVILANVQLMQRTLEEMEKYKPGLRLPQGAYDNLVVFSKARQLLKQLQELEQLTQQETSLQEV